MISVIGLLAIKNQIDAASAQKLSALTSLIILLAANQAYASPWSPADALDLAKRSDMIVVVSCSATAQTNETVILGSKASLSNPDRQSVLEAVKGRACEGSRAVFLVKNSAGRYEPTDSQHLSIPANIDRSSLWYGKPEGEKISTLLVAALNDQGSNDVQGTARFPWSDREFILTGNEVRNEEVYAILRNVPSSLKRNLLVKMLNEGNKNARKWAAASLIADGDFSAISVVLNDAIAPIDGIDGLLLSSLSDAIAMGAHSGKVSRADIKVLDLLRRSPVPDIRRAVIRVFRENSDLVDNGLLKKWLEDSDSTVRYLSVTALVSKAPEGEVLPTLEDYKSDEAYFLKRWK